MAQDMPKLARHQGTGRALVTALESIARTAGIRTLIGALSGSNPGALAFHNALGFNEVGRMPGIGMKFGKRLDLVTMQKSLSLISRDPPDRRAGKR